MSISRRVATERFNRLVVPVSRLRLERSVQGIQILEASKDRPDCYERSLGFYTARELNIFVDGFIEGYFRGNIPIGGNHGG